MATLSKGYDTWGSRGIIRRDFRHSKDGPEALPHQKPGKGKKFCKRAKADKTPHDFSKIIYVYKYKSQYDYEKKCWERVKSLVPVTICARCSKPERYYYSW